jgi:signal transduction histidine kinase
MGIRTTLAIVILVAGVPPGCIAACLAWEHGQGLSVDVAAALLGTLAAAFLTAWALGDRWLCRPLAGIAAAARALRRGVLALPVSAAGGPTVEATTACAPHSGSLPRIEVKLLDEVADDLALGLRQLRMHGRQRRHESELARQVTARMAELEAINRELERFACSVSHELRAPLRAIDGYAQLIAADYLNRLDAKGARMLERIRHGAGNMSRLIDALVEFSRAETGTMRRDRIDMNSLASGVIAELRDPSAPQHIDLDVGALPDAHGDGELLRRVWSNLLSNALKYSARVNGPRICVSGHHRGASVVYQVRDNGAGFDMQHYDRLFAVFQRLHRDSDFPGSGIGLAIAQRIVHRHGGEIWADSRPGEGASFHFSLPVHAGAEQPMGADSGLTQAVAA